MDPRNGANQQEECVKESQKPIHQTLDEIQVGEWNSSCNTSTESFSFSELPFELKLSVLNNLDVVSKLRLRRVNQEWNVLLRERSLFSTVILEAEGSDDDGDHAENLVYGLGEAGVWNLVSVLVVQGDYDLLREEPYSGFYPFPETHLLFFLMEAMRRQMKWGKETGFGNLQTLVINNAAVVLHLFSFIGETSKFRLLMTDCTFVLLADVLSPAGTSSEVVVEFEVKGTKSFQLSGRTTEMNAIADLRLSAWTDVSLPDDIFRLPVEIADFVTHRCGDVSPETVAQLGSVYSTLLKGRPNMLINLHVVEIFEKYFPLGAREERHWQLCQQYDYTTLSMLDLYALVYYSRPRNCFFGKEPFHSSWGYRYSKRKGPRFYEVL